jgi:hypothetical protein
MQFTNPYPVCRHTPLKRDSLITGYLLGLLLNPEVDVILSSETSDNYYRTTRRTSDLLFSPEDGSNMFLRNISELISEYTALHARR